MPDTVLTANPSAATAQVERTVATLRKVRDAVGQAIFGQDIVIEQTLVTLLAASSSGHVFAMELAATSQFVVQGSPTYRSIDPPAAFVVQTSPFGRPVFITTGPLAGSWNGSRL